MTTCQCELVEVSGGKDLPPQHVPRTTILVKGIGRHSLSVDRNHTYSSAKIRARAFRKEQEEEACIVPSVSLEVVVSSRLRLRLPPRIVCKPYSLISVFCLRGRWKLCRKDDAEVNEGREDLKSSTRCETVSLEAVTTDKSGRVAHLLWFREATYYTTNARCPRNVLPVRSIAPSLRGRSSCPYPRSLDMNRLVFL